MKINTLYYINVNIAVHGDTLCDNGRTLVGHDTYIRGVAEVEAFVAVRYVIVFRDPRTGPLNKQGLRLFQRGKNYRDSFAYPVDLVSAVRPFLKDGLQAFRDQATRKVTPYSWVLLNRALGKFCLTQACRLGIRTCSTVCPRYS